MPAASTPPPHAAPAPGYAPSFLARVRRDVALVIVAKIVFLALLYALFFSTGHRPAVTPERVDRLLFSHTVDRHA